MVNYSKHGNGPLLIYVPGLDGTGQLFFRQIPSLVDHFSIVTFALRQDPPFDYPDLARDILEILDRERIEKATIVAESFGGTVGLHFALQHQNRIEQLILVNTFPYFRRRILLRLGSLLLPLAFTRLIQVARRIFLKPLLLKEFVDEASMKTMFNFSLTHKPEAYRQRMELIRQLDVRESLSAISVPVTIVAAAKDKLVPSVKEAEWMSAKIPGSTVVVLPDHGHSCLISDNFSLVKILKQTGSNGDRI
jgi:pimeloyl-ACP methyl ester carboxylesterase